jgi:hypothetical protein
MDSPREVQCQRTRCYLPLAVAERGKASCPWCEDHETYERLPPTRFASKIITDALAMCRSEFGIDDDGIDTAVWLGDRPETVYEPKPNRVNIYLGRTSTPLQIRYSGAHEAFHRACSPMVGTHWADEMFAVLFSLLYLDRTGYADHANLNRTHLVSEAEACSTQTMFGAAGPCPDGLYGRAYLLGSSLIDSIGWEPLKTLAVTKGADGRMDADTWFASLTRTEREQVKPLLQGALSLGVDGRT